MAKYKARVRFTFEGFVEVESPTRTDALEIIEDSISISEVDYKTKPGVLDFDFPSEAKLNIINVYQQP